MSKNEAVGACGNCGSLSPWRCGCPGNSQDTWREQMYDLAASVWTSRKASPAEIREEIFAALAVSVPEDQEDALRDLTNEQVQEILLNLEIDDEEAEGSDLCQECYARVGECKPPLCGQAEEPEKGQKVDLPDTETGMVALLDEALHGWLDEYLGGSDSRVTTKTFEEAQIMTSNKGLVVKVGDREFQVQVVRSK